MHIEISLFFLFMLTILDFDEIHASTERIVNAYLTSKTLELKKKQEYIEYELYLLLGSYYIDGLYSTGLTKDIDVSSSDMQSCIYQTIAGKTFKDRVYEYVANNDVKALVRLLDSEAHRVYESAAYKTATDYQKATGKEVFKVWNTQGDLKVRDTHEYIDSLIKKLDEPFITFDLDEAQFPGGFNNAENNVNCRCWLSYTTSS
nr:MAG TPA: minor capsid protein [Caudoviricetes sp.]